MLGELSDSEPDRFPRSGLTPASADLTPLIPSAAAAFSLPPGLVVVRGVFLRAGLLLRLESSVPGDGAVRLRGVLPPLRVTAVLLMLLATTRVLLALAGALAAALDAGAFVEAAVFDVDLVAGVTEVFEAFFGLASLVASGTASDNSLPVLNN